MRPWITLARKRLALRDERGIALIMSLGIMLVLTIVLTSVIHFSSASSRHANISNAGQKAYALAEAGVNNAIAQIAPNYPNTTTAGDDSWTGCPALTTDSIGTTSWKACFDSDTSSWSLTGIGTVKNPTGGADITRTVNAKIPVTLGPPPFTRYGLFVDDAVGSCPSLSGDNTITVPIYSKGCLDVGGNQTIEEPNASGPRSTSVNIGGQLNVGGSAHIGTAARPIDWLAAGGGCNSPGGACPGASGIHAQTYGAHAPVALPVVDMNEQYAKANWSAATCATGSNPFDNNTTRNTSLSTTNLMGASYDCSVPNTEGGVSRLGWNDSASTTLNGIPPKTLFVEGPIFVDRNLSWGSNQGLQYDGDGTIYANGTVDIAGTICGPGSSWDGNNCGLTWSPLANLGALLIVAGNAGGAGVAVNAGSQAVIEAGLWIVTGNVDSTGHPYFGGSVFIDNGTGRLRGGGGLQAFINLPAGAPSGQQYILGTPSNFGGG
jgi:Tfp pilus assembly protein PilX